MSKFKVGDTVRCVDNPVPPSKHQGAGWKLGKEFIVRSIDKYADDEVLWPEDVASSGVWANYVELVKNKPNTIMSKLSIIAKKVFDGDTKTFIKAGFIDNELKLTQKGRDHLEAILFDVFKEDLIEEALGVLEEESEE